MWLYLAVMITTALLGIWAGWEIRKSWVDTKEKISKSRK